MGAMIERGVCRADEVVCTDKCAEVLESRRAEYHVQTRATVGETVAATRFVFLCTKPQDVGSVMAEVRAAWRADANDQVLVSILAGVKLASLAALLPPLVAACEASARDLLCSLPGSRVLAETFFATEGAARQALAEAVARCVAATDPSDDSRHGKAGLDDAPDEEDAGPAAHAIGHKAVQKLLAREAAAAPDGARPLWEALRAALQSFEKVDVRLTVWAKHNRMAFVLVEFVKTAPAARRADVRALFAPVVKALRALPADSLCAGASRLLEVLQ